MRMSYQTGATVSDQGPPGGWGPYDTHELRKAVAAAGHTQEAFARALKAFGLASQPSQPTVSRWLRGGSTPTPQVRPALRKYRDAYLPGVGDQVSDSVAADGPKERWNEVLRDLSGEPMLGPRQAEYVDSITARIAKGPPMSAADAEALRIAAQVLGLPMGGGPAA